MRTLLISALLISTAVRAEIVDRISVLADGHAIKSSDINEEVRITQFLNQEKLDTSLDERRKAADRLIEQAVIRKEREAGQYSDPEREEVDSLFAQIQQRYPDEAALDQALKAYGITREDLIRHLEWQLAVLQFIRVRFLADQTASPDAKEPPKDPNAEFFAWLDENRKKIRLIYKEEGLKWAAKPSGS
jgi:hypothetical protein